MEELQSYSPVEIIASNLDELRCRSMQTREQLLAHLCELATEIADSFTDPIAFLASLPEYRPLAPRGQMYTEADAQAYAFVYSTYERALLCIELRKRIPLTDTEWNDLFFPSGEGEVDAAPANKISYQRNNYTDEAFGCFSEVLGGARVLYASDFTAVCENVYNGICEYGILPIETSEDGRLGNFARLISRYDLRICATCDVKIEEERITRYALLRRSIALLPRDASRQRFLEGSCTLTDYPRAQDLLEAARICGLTIERADLKRADHEACALQLTLSTEGGDLPAFLLYLAMEIPSFHTVGYYPNYKV